MFFPSVSCFQDRPSEPMCYLVSRNLDQLLKICITDATEFISTTQIRGKALEQLKYTMLLSGAKITKHVETILKTLIKISQLQIQNCAVKVREIVEIIGYYVPSDYYVPLLMDMLKQEEFKNSQKSTVTLLNLLSHMLLTSQNIENHVGLIAKHLEHYQVLFIENNEGLLSIFQIGSTIIKRLTRLSPELTQILFSIVINVQSTKTIGIEKREQAVECMSLLASKAEFASVADLHAHQVGPILEKIINNKEYASWNKTSKDRFKFDTIIRNCHSEVSRFLPQTLTILEYLVNPQNDLETRMDTLVLIEAMIRVEQLQEPLKSVSEQILRKVLIPAIQWKVGQPQIKIREAGVINIIALIRNKMINEEQLLGSFRELFPHLKNCLNETWAVEVRLASCALLEQFLLATKNTISEELTEIYPSLLERLDDSQHQIRVKVTAAINVFFNCDNLRFSPSTFEYMVGAIFVHLDDNLEEIRDAIFMSLRYASKVNSKEVLKIAESHLKKMKHKQKCQELIDCCQEHIRQYQL